MMNGNKRYLGDVWINQENLERQREFFRDIIESYQDRYGGEFDASTLQGKSASDFATAEQGNMALHSIQEPLIIGRTSLMNTDSPQYLTSESMLLEEDDQTAGSAANRLRTLSWYSNLTKGNLTESLVSIYDNVIAIKTELENSITTQLNDFVTQSFEPIEELINNSKIEVTDIDTGETRQGLNAQTLNGIRIILVTQDGYNALKNSSDPQKQAIISDYRNLFVIVESLPPTYTQPWEYSITDPFQFRVYGDYLQVKTDVSPNWKIIAPVTDFFGAADFGGIIENQITTSDGFVINSDSLQNSLIGIPTTAIDENWEAYPFLSSSLHDELVRTITTNGSDNYITETLDSDSFKNVDINMNQLLKDKEVLSQDGTTRINQIMQDLATEQNNLAQAQGALASVTNKVNQLDTTTSNQQATLNSISSQLSSIQNNITSINSRISSIQSDVTNKNNAVKSWSYPTIATYDTNCISGYVNTELRLVFAYINDVFSYTAKKSNQYIKTGEIVRSGYRPKKTVVFASHTPYTVGKVGTDGVIWGKSIYASGGNIALYGTCMWYY